MVLPLFAFRGGDGCTHCRRFRFQSFNEGRRAELVRRAVGPLSLSHIAKIRLLFELPKFQHFFLYIPLFFLMDAARRGGGRSWSTPGRCMCMPSGCFRHPYTRRRRTVRAMQGAPSSTHRRRAASVPVPGRPEPPRHI